MHSISAFILMVSVGIMAYAIISGVLLDGWPKTMKFRARQAEYRQKVRDGVLNLTQAADDFQRDLGFLWVFYYSTKPGHSRNYIEDFYDAAVEKIYADAGLIPEDETPNLYN